MQQVVSLALKAGNMGLALEVLPTCQLERRGWSIYYKMTCYENNYNMHKMDVQITTVRPDLDSTCTTVIEENGLPVNIRHAQHRTKPPAM